MLGQRCWNRTARGRSEATILRRDDRWRGAVCSPRQVVAHCIGLRVLLNKTVDSGYSSEFGQVISAVNDLEIATGGVILVLAAHGALSLHTGAPIPHEIGRERLADLTVGWDEQVGLTDLFQLHSRLARWMVAVGHLSVNRDWCLIELVASAIVVVLSCHEPTFSIATLAIFRPRENIDEGFGCAGLVCAKDEDCATTGRLTSRNVGLSDMAVLKVLQSDIGARCDRKLRVL